MIGSPQLHQSITIAALVCLALIPPLILIVLSAEYIWYFFLGGFSWAVAVAVKRIVGSTPQAKSLMRAGIAGALFWGLISGVLELGALWAFVAWFELPLRLDVGIACGLGASTFEIFYLIVTGINEERHYPDKEKYKRWLEAARQSSWVAHIAPIERSSATVIHVAARAAILVSLADGDWPPAAIALAMFTLVDGAATYGVAQEWDWFNPRICRTFYLGIFAVGAAGSAFLILWS